MSAASAALLLGAGVGLSIAAPIGPTSLMCIERTLAAGISRGLAAGLGVATVHLIYGGLTVAGGVGLAQPWLGTAAMSLASGLILLWFAARVLRSTPVLGGRVEARRTLAASYALALGFGFLNPATPLLFLGATPRLLAGGVALPPPMLVAGIFLGSLAWWCALSGGIWLLRGRLTDRGLGLMNKVAGLTLAGLAASMIVRAWPI